MSQECFLSMTDNGEQDSLMYACGLLSLSYISLLLCPTDLDCPSSVYITVQLVVLSVRLQVEPLRVCITGAAGQVAYSLFHRIANGDIFGKNRVLLDRCACLSRR